MKVKDIIPGMPVIVPGGYLKWKDVKDGRTGVPAIVLGFGRYRLAQQGPCGFIVTEDPREWERPKVVVLRQKGDFYRGYGQRQPGEIAPDTEWQLDLVSQYQLLPVDVWDTFHQEYLLLQLDVEALNDQRTALYKERQRVIMADPGIRQAVLDLIDLPPDSERDERFDVRTGSNGLILSGFASYSRLSAETQASILDIDRQTQAIDKKLECAR